jgi:hypothetical protein
MSEPEDSGENFLQRWSRLKQATGSGASASAEPRESKDDEPGAPPDISKQIDPPAFDPSSLPPIESITGASDIRAFLAPGVPEELSRAALRRAWVSDPTIRDFVGIAENQWDFTRPDDVPGFGSLDVTAEELRWLVDQLVGTAARLPQAASPVELSQQESGQGERDAIGPDAVHNSEEADGERQLTDIAEPAAPPKEPLDVVSGSSSARRRHGGALPR